MSAALLGAAAFGGDPGRWPLPAARTPHELWLRAVAAGGQGRYGSATADLAALRRLVGSGALASLAHSTQASFLRQLGGHAAARRWDGRALALAGDDTEAGIDALLGLGADALGVGRLAASAALLDRARTVLEKRSAPDRLPVRCHWVGAELAMARGDAAEAVAQAEMVIELAGGLSSARHRLKTQVVYAAALCCAGKIEQARATAEEALTVTGRLGLLPLRWAAASLLVDISDTAERKAELTAVRDTCAEAVRRAGGVWRR